MTRTESDGAAREPDDFRLLIEGKIESAEYVRRLRARVAEQRANANHRRFIGDRQGVTEADIARGEELAEEHGW